MEFKQFMGVDVSKNTLDITVRDELGLFQTETLVNGKKEINQFLKTYLRRESRKMSY